MDIPVSNSITRYYSILWPTSGPVVVAAKSTSDASSTKPFPPDLNSQQSTINTVEREIREAGGEATAIAVDTRDFESVQKLVDQTIKVGFHVVVYA